MSTPGSHVDLSISDERIDHETAVVTVAGDLDVHTAPRLKRRMAELIHHEGCRRFVIDLRRVEFIDSTAIGVLVGRRKELTRRGGSIALVCSDQSVLGIFEIAGLPALFEIHDSPEAALAVPQPIA